MEDPRSATCRAAAFQWLQTHWEGTGETIPRETLRHGFPFEGEGVQLIGPQGIFKPRQIAHFPLSITTTTKTPYSDFFEPGNDFLLYSSKAPIPITVGNGADGTQCTIGRVAVKTYAISTGAANPGALIRPSRTRRRRRLNDANRNSVALIGGVSI